MKYKMNEESLSWLNDALNRGIDFDCLHLFDKERAIKQYQKDTGDMDIAERGFALWGWHPITFQCCGDDSIGNSELVEMKKLPLNDRLSFPPALFVAIDISE